MRPEATMIRDLRLCRAAATLLCISACSRGERTEPKEPAAPMTITLTSPAFAANGSIPAAHTCDGRGLSPPLAWSGVPAGTKSLALILDDPDAPDPKAPKTTWVHWVIYNLPPAATSLPAGANASLPPGTLQGHNDWKATGYRGPCPPTGRHRYVHKLYALDAVLPDLHEPSKADLESAMGGHLLARGELVGTYEKSR
jgi:Raf kinase inhibitor-like YbhB/YbcL family protein